MGQNGFTDEQRPLNDEVALFVPDDAVSNSGSPG